MVGVDEGGVIRAWDVVMVVERNTNMVCSRSRWGGVRHVCDLIGMGCWRRNMSMGCDRSGRRGTTRVWDVVCVGEG